VLTTHGLLSYHTAGELWGVVETRSDLVHVVITHDRRLTAPTGVRLHRWRPRDVPATTLDGLPVTPRSWTILSMLGRMHPEEGTRLADRAVQRGWLTKLDLDERLRSHPGRHGNPRLRILAQTIGDGAAAGSERQLHRVLRTAGVVGWVPNYPVWVGGELVAVVDVALPHRRIAIELDGMAHHVDVDRFQRDRTRQNALVALGWTVLRFTWSDVAHRPGYVVSTLRGV
jgi:very-short-patch-repair endonuclease